jgi:spore maturation protein CgeB
LTQCTSSLHGCGVFRHAVRWVIETEQDIDLYGKGWELFVKDHRFKGHHIFNEVLPEFYARFRVVLCDHWEDMGRYGYLSNRVFDVMTCGLWLAVDEVAHLKGILLGGYSLFRTKEELRDVLNQKRFGTQAERKNLATWVAKNHTFKQRAETIAGRIEMLLSHHAQVRELGIN